MTVGSTGQDGPQSRQADASARSSRIFINYRHEDTWGEALVLYDRLANSFGADNVFLDQRNLQPGMRWLEEIKAHRDACGVLLSLIGPRWMSIMKRREQEAREHALTGEPAEDYVRFELEYALRRGSGISVVPVLVGDSVPLLAEMLPRSLQPLAEIEVEQVRQKRFEDDVTHLIARLEAMAAERPTPTLVPPKRQGGERTRAPASTVVAPAPDAAHCELVLQHIADEGNLVSFLGPQLAAEHPGSQDGPMAVSDARRLAADLAERSGVRSARQELPEVAQYVYVTRGRPDLYRMLRQILTPGPTPGPVHRFMARLPQELEALQLENRYQLIVTTNFDRALEQAFDDEHEPYDLAVYMASGQDKGKFVHFPYEGGPTPITKPNSYVNFPIGDYGDLERTVIMKIHGAIDGGIGDYRWKENYVITEDHYIDYLSRSPIESLVPVQILDKLRDSHCLFLGYTVRDWNLRVFLKRIWKGEPLGAKSWAVEPDPDTLEKEFWAQSYVDLYASDLADYVDLLQERLAARTSASAES